MGALFHTHVHVCTACARSDTLAYIDTLTHTHTDMHTLSHTFEPSRTVISSVTSSPIISSLIKLNVKERSVHLSVSLSMIAQDRPNICFIESVTGSPVMSLVGSRVPTNEIAWACFYLAVSHNRK